MNKSEIYMSDKNGDLFTIVPEIGDYELINKTVSIILEDYSELIVLKDYVSDEEKSKKILKLSLECLAAEWVRDNVGKGNLLRLQKPYEDFIDSSLIGCENMRNMLERRRDNVQRTMSLSSTRVNTDICIKIFLQDLAYSIDNELTEVIRQHCSLVKIKEDIDKIKDDTSTVKRYLDTCITNRITSN
jgi:hypothetical protein